MLGNGVTGDFGMNIVGWCSQLNRENPDYVNWLDGVAFHPYNCGLDYMNGLTFRYRNVIRDISDTLKVKKPLWNTENYYLPTAYSRQINYYVNKERYGANEIARQFLDGFLNGVKATMASSTNSFYRQENVNGLSAPNDVFAATNALSALLAGMDSVEELPLSSWVRCGMFRSRDGRRALGFLYDMRPSGSVWIPGDTKARVLDIYGNPAAGGRHRLKFEPYYVTGAPEEVRQLLMTSRFELQNPVKIRARRFGETTFFEGENLTGLPEEIRAKIDTLPVEFSFRGDTRLNTIAVDGFRGSLNGIPLVPETPCYRLLAKLALADGSRAELTFDGKALVVNVAVRDPQVRPGKVFHAGSCVELFLDEGPFRNLARDAASPLQLYGTPAGEKGALRNGKRVEFPFEFVSSAIPGGYRATFRIPEAREYVGLDLIVTRGDGGKERIPGVEGRSFRERFHYPLFRLAENSRLENGSFERCNTLSMPKHWLYDIRYGTAFRCVPEAGYAGRGMAVVVEREQKVPVLVMQRVEFPAGRFRRATLSFLAKLDEVKSPKEGKGKFGMQVRFGMKRHGESAVERTRKQDITGTSEWTLYQFPVTLRNNTDFLEIGLGLGPETTGKLCIDNVRLVLE